jgi:cytochrome c oxidase subunit IV
MSHPHPLDAHAAHGAAGSEPGHASTGTYIKVAAILCAVTALEFSVIYVRRLTPILIPLLLVLSAGKFALVAMFFMHLRYDRKPLTFIFVSALVLASGIALALTTLTGEFLVYKR